MTLTRRLTAVAAIVVAAMMSPACAQTAGTARVSLDQLCAETFVVACETGGTSTVVVIQEQTPADDINRLAEQLHVVAAQRAGDIVMRAESSEPRTLDPEVAPPYEWQISMEPGDTETFKTTVAGTLAAASVPGAVGIAVIDGWPYVTVERLEQFEDVFSRVSATPLFQDGGTYTLQSLDERLRIVHVPTRTNDDAIVEIIAVARDYPNAEVLLEAPTSGPQTPTFYVSRLSPSQQHELDMRLREPRLADADVDGYALEYVLGSTGENGTTYTSGTFGSVPG
ncbi:hypothetical protein JOD63_000705 [Microbacterium terrae]|uniref:Uncharacterized protein n=1 Tax=Microbacterium terrae TaxID=69369 RepID=A0A0M2HKN2_9MICO|nr:hypothetical protein [Microbacterium terrae]KJL44927.1 hypothetical protein RS81_00395 [Microbacterium terrae]MBP1076737.1 hypothetical protein [Microbacterium terrae]GLJ97568.1 hypothetical protein GCM10017594_07650 [Microbacterium terrae]